VGPAGEMGPQGEFISLLMMLKQKYNVNYYCCSLPDLKVSLDRRAHHHSTQMLSLMFTWTLELIWALKQISLRHPCMFISLDDEEVLDANYNERSTALCGSNFCFQSFTAKHSGFITRLWATTGCANNNAASPYVQITQGDCVTDESCQSGQTILGEFSFGAAECTALLGQQPNEWLFDQPIPVSEGQRYTFEVRNDVAYVDTDSSAYAGGQAYGNLNNGNVPFKIFLKELASVAVGVAGSSVNFSGRFHIKLSMMSWLFRELTQMVIGK